MCLPEVHAHGRPADAPLHVCLSELHAHSRPADAPPPARVQASLKALGRMAVISPQQALEAGAAEGLVTTLCALPHRARLQRRGWQARTIR